jgi:Uma2 family endonuclease
MTAEQYFALVDDGTIAPDERVELLEGVVVSMSPANSRHATAVALADDALRAALGPSAAVRVQSPLILSARSVPEPEVAVVAGRTRDYARAHPTTALLVVEVSDSTLPQERLTKAAIYAAAGVPEYWIVNLRADQVEVYRGPHREMARYGDVSTARAGERSELVSFPGVTISADDLLPER